METGDAPFVSLRLDFLTGVLAESEDSVLITDVQGKILWVNATFTGMTGYSQAEVIGKKPGMLKSGLNGQSFYEDLWCTIKAGRRWSGTLYNKRKSGELYLEKQTIIPFYGNDGSIENFIAFKKEMRKAGYLPRLPEYARHFSDSLSEAVICTDKNLTVTFWNKGAERIYGWNSEEALGNNIIGLVLRNFSNPEIAARERMLERAGEIREVVHASRKDGTRILVERIVAPIKSDGDRVTGYVGWHRRAADFANNPNGVETERIAGAPRARKGSRSASKLTPTAGNGKTVAKWEGPRASEKERNGADSLPPSESAGLLGLGRMAAYLSHEIKTPLNSILMNIDFLSGSPEISASERKSFEIIRREIVRLNSLASTVLRYPDRGRRSLAPVRIDRVVDDLCLLFGPAASQKNMKFVNRLEEVEITTDRDKIDSVFVQLIDNAIEAGRSGGEIEFYSEKDLDEGKLLIYVRDDGRGTKNPDKIFQPFFTEKENGTGLGLAFVREILTGIGGEIELASSEAGETVFKLVFEM